MGRRRLLIATPLQSKPEPSLKLSLNVLGQVLGGAYPAPVEPEQLHLLRTLVGAQDRSERCRVVLGPLVAIATQQRILTW